jgi:hypothetical protein
LARPLIIPVVAGPAAGATSGRASAARASIAWAGTVRTGSTRARAGSSSRRVAWRWGLLLAVGWLGQAGLRVWFSWGQVVPLANPDETAYLIAARVLAGGTGGDLSGSTLYQGGYPLLITPAYWFTSNPVTVYHAVLVINAVISALLLPLGYLACRRLGLDRLAAYGVAMVAALVPAGFFYSEYAMTDAIFPVLTLAWLLTVHSWLTAPSARGRYAAAASSALLSGFAYTVHSRGLIMLVVYAVTGIVIGVRRLAPRGTVLAAGLTALVTAGAGWSLDRYLTSAVYPEGIRSLTGQLLSRLTSSYGTVHVVEMAGGQMWRLTLDSWGIAGIGLIAALAAIVRRGLRTDLRIMAAISVAITIGIACVAPAALPADQSQTWASGRYLDGMIVAFFLLGAVVLLRARTAQILGYAAAAAGLTVLAAVTVAVYAGTSLPVTGFGNGFNFAEPAVLTQNWTQASVLAATAVALGLLACWVLLALVVRRGRGVMLAAGLGGLGLGVAAVSLVALAQMTSHVSHAGTSAATASTTGMVTAARLKPGEQIAIASDVNWEVWIPQTFEISWTEPEFFDPASQSPPAGVSVVETNWTAGQPSTAGWPHHPAGWRVVASDRTVGWAVWRKA